MAILLYSKQGLLQWRCQYNFYLRSRRFFHTLFLLPGMFFLLLFTQMASVPHSGSLSNSLFPCLQGNLPEPSWSWQSLPVLRSQLHFTYPHTIITVVGTMPSTQQTPNGYMFKQTSKKKSCLIQKHEHHERQRRHDWTISKCHPQGSFSEFKEIHLPHAYFQTITIYKRICMCTHFLIHMLWRVYIMSEYFSRFL